MAGPRPREVGGACRIQVLAAARTQETVGGPNGAKRSEFRRSCPPVDVTLIEAGNGVKPRQDDHISLGREVGGAVAEEGGGVWSAVFVAHPAGTEQPLGTAVVVGSGSVE